MAENDPVPTSGNGYTTKDTLIRLEAKLDGMDKKIDLNREGQIRIETILEEGRFGERLASVERWQAAAEAEKHGERIACIETFKVKAEGGLGLIRWAVGASAIGLILGVIQLLNLMGHAAQ